MYDDVKPNIFDATRAPHSLFRLSISTFCRDDVKDDDISSTFQATAEHSERPFSTLETRSRISSFQSHASRRDREFLSLGLVLRDENENLILQSHVSRREQDFFSSVSCFETRTRIFTFSLILRDENFCLNSCTSRREREQC